ncbi:phosphate signaling complex protein PhoU [Paenibacillus dendritiformis]|uniref:Phosphate-specific transport system accessory protein PhoU n=1 Tax=Paenibacillus melissococcoides TaxID=2912268 RepID=A0ABM9G580_9BACL|nr:MULTISPECIES: phosphate signaling complex protein PhoU [Paenibacillus]MEB9894150.1 phosphate signaling complex protein PhoU [Bacillus cereus]TDL57298.1 phosphate signaling complex protein PhoU [Paenibacillus dendritiformis]WGU94861.1 phosphate signaling complex protein PhoU [Paenibacillus dendritiformis]CAH8246965.1 phosphate signaling complex protein PhoU [Paenibacillus melissococcoides]CAH8716339.1 phosphate signaling complex protein PhoU [Paenibacillus melissococcoides]
MIKRREFDLGLDELSRLLEQMGSHVERALFESIESLKTMDAERARAIINEDPTLNRMEDNIIELGSKLILTQQPVAKDLRRILVAFRISSDLERMGDLSIDIAKVVLRIEGQTLMKPLIDLPRMAEIVQQMITDSIRAYVQEDIDLAYKMAKDDDQVDQLYSQIFRELLSYVLENPHNASQAMLLTFVGRYIERIADHATNIGESVVYLVTNERPDLNS